MSTGTTTTSTRELSADARWRAWVGEHPVLGPALVGLIATQLATIIGYYLKGIGLPPVPWPLYNGALFAPTGKFGDPASFFAGQSIHMVDGVVFALLFAIMVRYVPKSGYGFFSFYSPDGWKLPLSILLFHLVYGYFLGALSYDRVD